MEKEDKYRFNLELTPQAKAQLDELQARTGAASLSEVIRKALATYDALCQQKSEGWEVMLKKKGAEKTVILL